MKPDFQATEVRRPAVAGFFYPAEADDLRAAVNYYLSRTGPSERVPKAIIAPHAGYIYSGPVAASAYAGWRDLGTSVKRVVLLGPSHRVHFQGMALPSVTAFETPLGRIPIDEAARTDLSALSSIRMDDTPHAEEHSLEVQLPFLQVLFPDFQLVPIAVGDCPAATVAEALELLWDSDETRIVISSDLSHYHAYDVACDIDTETSAAICALEAEAIRPEQACGCMPVRGLLHYARGHHLQITELDRRNSGDTAGPRDRVVGYGAYAVHA